MISTYLFIWLSLILCVPKCMLLLLLYVIVLFNVGQNIIVPVAAGWVAATLNSNVRVFLIIYVVSV